MHFASSFTSAVFFLSFKLNSLVFVLVMKDMMSKSVTLLKCHQRELLFHLAIIFPQFIHLVPLLQHSPSHLMAFDLSFHFLSPITLLPPPPSNQTDPLSAEEW